MMDEYPLLGKCFFSMGCEGFCDSCSPKENHLFFKYSFLNKAKTIYGWKEKAYRGFEKLHFVGGVGVIGKARRSSLLSKRNPILINEPQDFDKYYYPQDATSLRESLGIPNVLIEAMSVGVPAVATDCTSGGPAFLTDNGKRGLLVSVDDVDAMADAICKILESPKLSEQLSEAGKEICSLLEEKSIAKQWVDMFTQIISDKQ